jgi:hypothetical protein
MAAFQVIINGRFWVITEAEPEQIDDLLPQNIDPADLRR